MVTRSFPSFFSLREFPNYTTFMDTNILSLSSGFFSSRAGFPASQSFGFSSSMTRLFTAPAFWTGSLQARSSAALMLGAEEQWRSCLLSPALPLSSPNHELGFHRERRDTFRVELFTRVIGLVREQDANNNISAG